MVRAKFICNTVTERGWQGKVEHQDVELTAVYSANPNDPNHTWSEATPSGNIKMTITNPAAFGKFKPGVAYYIDFTEETTRQPG